jgi:hypothetical protein
MATNKSSEAANCRIHITESNHLHPQMMLQCVGVFSFRQDTITIASFGIILNVCYHSFIILEIQHNQLQRFVCLVCVDFKQFPTFIRQIKFAGW